MTNLHRVSRCFWTHFSPDIQSGVPVYFNFSKHLISTLIAEEFDIPSMDTAFDFFIQCIRTSFTTRGNKVEIHDDVFRRNETGTNVIALIALQVLAAELMSKEGNEYSSAAYFPPLRKLMGPDLGIDSNLPFSETQFKQLWDSFRGEVLRVNPNAHITFDVSGKGVNLNRIFPLSQALLNQRDLIILASAFYVQGYRASLEKTIEINWRTFLLNNCRRLSRRGYFCVTNEFLRQAITDQLISFVQHFQFNDIVKMEKKLHEIDTSFKLMIKDNDEDTFFSGESELVCFFFDENEAPIDDFEGKKRLIKYFENKPYLVLRDIDGCFKGDPLINFEDQLNKVCFLTTNTQISSLLEASLKHNHLQLREKSFVNDSSYRLFFIEDDRVRNSEISVTKGILRTINQNPQISFFGGLKTDNRGHNYFANCPPTSILFNSTLLSKSTNIQVNHSNKSIADFFENLSAHKEGSYLIRYNDCDAVLNLRHANIVLNSVGNKIDRRSIRINNTEIYSSDRAIVGFRFQNLANIITISRNDFLSLFIPEASQFESLTEESLTQILESIDRSNEIGESQKLYMKIFLRRSMTAPISILQKIKKAA